jgi:proteic killer suppression protein
MEVRMASGTILDRASAVGKRDGVPDLQARHKSRLRIQLTTLDSAIRPEDMDAPGWQLHPLNRQLAGHWAISVNGNWRLTFTFEGENAVLVDYQDYH